MHKKFLMTATAVATSITMAAAPMITVFAEDTDKTVIAKDAETKEIKGNVTVDGGSAGVYVTGEKSEVTIEGNVTTTGENTTSGSYSSGETYEYTKGGTGVSAQDGATATVSGNITTSAGADGVNASKSKVNVGGDITTTGTNTSKHPDHTYNDGGTGVYAYNGSEVNISGNIAANDGGEGIQAYDSSTINVEGSVSTSGQHVSEGSYYKSNTGGVAVGAYDEGTKVNINGDVTATGGGNAISAGSKSAVNVAGNVNSSGQQSSTSTDSEGTSYSSTSAGYGIYAYNGASVNVDKNVTGTDGGYGVYANGEGTTVNVKGDVNTTGTTNSKSGDKSYTYGSTGVASYSDSTVNVGGDVTADSVGIRAYTDSTVKVDGNVNTSGADYTESYYDQEKKDSVPETKFTGKGLYTDGDADVTVGKDINAATTGIHITPDNDNAAGTIIVQGMINVGKDGEGIKVGYDNPEKRGAKYESVEDFIDDLPVLIVGGISADKPVEANANINGDTSAEMQAKVTEAVKKAINYIIGVDEASQKQCGMEVSGDDITQIANYNTINVNESFKLAAKIPEGYDLVISENVTVKNNGDGTYTVTLINEKGGINVRAVLRKVEEKVEVVSVSETQETNVPPAGSDVVPAGAIVVSTAAAPAAGNTTADTTTAAISGEKAAKTMNINLGKVTTAQYKTAVIENIATAPANGAFNIVTDRVSVFDRKMIEAFAKRSDIDINVVFTYLGRKIKITIPAGYNVLTLLDENGYCGFLRLLQLLGGTDL